MTQSPFQDSQFGDSTHLPDKSPSHPLGGCGTPALIPYLLSDAKSHDFGWRLAEALLC